MSQFCICGSSCIPYSNKQGNFLCSTCYNEYVKKINLPVAKTPIEQIGPCTMCKENTKLVILCDQCDKTGGFICNTCKKLHDRIYGHTLVEPFCVNLPICEKHNKPCIYFCAIRNEPICDICPSKAKKDFHVEMAKKRQEIVKFCVSSADKKIKNLNTKIESEKKKIAQYKDEKEKKIVAYQSASSEIDAKTQFVNEYLDSVDSRELLGAAKKKSLKKKIVQNLGDSYELPFYYGGIYYSCTIGSRCTVYELKNKIREKYQTDIKLHGEWEKFWYFCFRKLKDSNFSLSKVIIFSSDGQIGIGLKRMKGEFDELVYFDNKNKKSSPYSIFWKLKTSPTSSSQKI